ncbi:hypothetical protein ACOI4D_04640 [Escherichia coli]
MGISFMVIVWVEYFCPDDLKANCAMKNRSHQAPVCISDDGVYCAFS